MANHTQLHFLVNNAGIHYVSTEGNPLNNLSYPVVSPQVRPSLTQSCITSLLSLPPAYSLPSATLPFPVLLSMAILSPSCTESRLSHPTVTHPSTSALTHPSGSDSTYPPPPLLDAPPTHANLQTTTTPPSL